MMNPELKLKRALVESFDFFSSWNKGVSTPRDVTSVHKENLAF